MVLLRSRKDKKAWARGTTNIKLVACSCQETGPSASPSRHQPTNSHSTKPHSATQHKTCHCKRLDSPWRQILAGSTVTGQRPQQKTLIIQRSNFNDHNPMLKSNVQNPTVEIQRSKRNGPNSTGASSVYTNEAQHMSPFN